MWFDPPGAFLDHLLANFSLQNQKNLIFYLGDITYRPAWHFYLISLILRLPEIFILFLIIGFVAGKNFFKALPQLKSLIYIIIIVFLLALSFGSPKKDERYLLSLYPFLAIIAASGILYVAEKFKKVFFKKLQLKNYALVLAGSIILIYYSWILVSFFPYYFLYFNTIASGPNGARDLVPVGWGEGLREAAQYLNQKTEASERKDRKTTYLLNRE